MYQIAQNSQASPHTGELDVSLHFQGQETAATLPPFGLYYILPTY